jgi:hypothetical protein
LVPLNLRNLYRKKTGGAEVFEQVSKKMAPKDHFEVISPID